MDGGRSADTLSLESKLKSNEKVIAHQNAQVSRRIFFSFDEKNFRFQIDFLHESNRALERRLHEVTETKRNLSEKQFEERLRNDDLLRDLKDIDRLARKVHADKELTIDAADWELNEAKVMIHFKRLTLDNVLCLRFQIEIQQNHRELQTLDTRIASLTSVKLFLFYFSFESTCDFSFLLI